MNKLLLIPCFWLVWVLIAAPDRQAEVLDIRQQLSSEVDLRSQSLTNAMEKYRMAAVLLSRSSIISKLFDSDDPSSELIEKVGFVQSIAGVSTLALQRRGESRWYPDISSVLPLAKTDQWRQAVQSAYHGTLGRAFYVNDAGRPIYVFLTPHYLQEHAPPAAVVLVAVDLGLVRDSWDVSRNGVSIWSLSDELMMANNVGRADKTVSVERLHGQLGAVLRVAAPPLPLFGSWWLRAALVTTLLVVAGLVISWLQERRKLRNELTEQRAGEAVRLEREVQQRTDELKKAQQKLMLTEKLALLGQMSASISHEINQPLAAVKNYSSTAQRLLERNDTDGVDKNLRQIASLTDRISRVVVNLRSFATREPSPVQSVELSEVIQDGVSDLVDRFPRAEPFCKIVRSDTAALLHAQAGRIRLLQVLGNLLTNAWYACCDELVPKVEISVSLKPDMIEIGIRDNGPGFSADVSTSAFDAFVSSRDSDIGLGLGLSISRSFIESMGGTLELRESLTRGALLVISLQRVT
ncbi:MAG: ATP-binding protein [Granulosicoccaceae bacterium]